jgi:protein subunit release factor B
MFVSRAASAPVLFSHHEGHVILPEEKTLHERMEALGVREQDIQEQFVRSSGAGGQKVNKTSTCVMLYHPPSGIRVKCQAERSQARNRLLARKILLEKVEAKIKRAELAQEQELARMRRQKSKPSRRVRLKILADKRHQAAKKSARAAVRPVEYDD